MDTDKILGDSLVSSLRLLAGLLRGIILIPIITKLIGEAEYGTWVVLLAVVNIAASIGGLHLHGALIRYTPREEREGQTLVDVLSLGLAISILLAILTYAVGMFDLIPRGRQGNSILLAVSLLVGLKIILPILKNYPRAQNRVKTYEIIKMFHLLSDSFLLAVVFWWYESLAVGLWTMVGVSVFFCFALGVIYLPRRVQTPNLSSFPTYLRYSVPMVPKVMGDKSLTNADKYLINFLISPSAVAVYAVSYSLAKLLRNITDPLNSTLYPAVSTAWEEDDFAGLQEVYRRIFRWYTILGVPAVVGISILAEPLLTFISTTQIAREGKFVLPALAFSFYIYGYNNPIEYILAAAEETPKLGIIAVIAAVVNIIINLATIPTLGILGAVIATLISQVLIVGYVYYSVRKRISITLSNIPIFRSSFAALIMATVLVFQPFDIATTLRLIVFPVVGSVVYFTTLVTIGEISKQDIEAMTTLLSQNFL